MKTLVLTIVLSACVLPGSVVLASEASIEQIYSPRVSVSTPAIIGHTPELNLVAPTFSMHMSDISSIMSSYGLPSATGNENVSEIFQSGDDNFGAALQFGTGNASRIMQTGNLNYAQAYQSGMGNSSAIYQTGNGFRSTVVQMGNGNRALSVQMN